MVVNTWEMEVTTQRGAEQAEWARSYRNVANYILGIETYLG